MNKIKPKALVPVPLAGAVRSEPLNVRFTSKPVTSTVLKHRTIMILEDEADYIREFERAVGALGSHFKICVWRDAPTMQADGARPGFDQFALYDPEFRQWHFVQADEIVRPA